MALCVHTKSDVLTKTHRILFIYNLILHGPATAVIITTTVTLRRDVFGSWSWTRLNFLVSTGCVALHLPIMPIWHQNTTGNYTTSGHTTAPIMLIRWDPYPATQLPQPSRLSSQQSQHPSTQIYMQSQINKACLLGLCCSLALQCFLGKPSQNSLVLLKMTINSYTFYSYRPCLLSPLDVDHRFTIKMAGQHFKECV